MNRRRLLVMGVLALSLGGAVSLPVYRQLQLRAAPSRPEADVIIAADDLQVGAKIGERDLRVVKYPSENLPAHVFHRVGSIVGRGVVLPIEKGEFVVADRLAGENGIAGLSSLIAVGMRAAAVRVNDVTAVAGFVTPGSRVDVLVTGNATGSGEPWSTTVLQNVAVLASGQSIERNSAGAPQAAPGVVTLLVSPEDAEKLALASQEARIQLVLRNPVDAVQEKPAAIKRSALFGGTVAPRPAKLVRVKNSPTHVPEPQMFEVQILQGDKKEKVDFKQ
jgi:pilus assembly protein CpaB